MPKLRQHTVVLEGQTSRCLSVRLRPMTEDDWDVLYRWNNDPEVLYYAEGDDITSYALDQVQKLYRGVSQKAFCFIIEADGEPIGECWLQEMNLDRVLSKYPGLDCRRIDLAIGEKRYWGQGIGTEAIRLLTEFGFLDQGADIVYEPEIADYNVRSRRAFQRVGYEIVAKIEGKPGKKARYGYDLALTRETFFESRHSCLRSA